MAFIDAEQNDVVHPRLRYGRNESSDGSTNLHETGSTHFIGKDPRLLEVWGLVNEVADTDATVLITGESGTGKDLIAQALHQGSSRCRAPFIAINCGAIAETLQESELFGHTKGAFTGAMTGKMGKFAAAHGGTIFLDEISDKSQYCDVWIIAATNQNLKSLVDAGEFRQDLYYRLNIIHLTLPPLRERKGDIPHCRQASLV